MSGQLTMDDKANEYASVHGFGEDVRCRKDGGTVVCKVLNGTAKAFYKDKPAIYAPEKPGYWSICRVDSHGAECRHELRGV